MKLSIWPFFILLICIQLAVPGSMIWKKEMILVKGTPYKFLTAPIDPYDPFIGKYIVLNFREQAYTLPPKQDVDDDAPVYISFRNNKNGFAEIDKVTKQIPEGSDYLKTNVSRINREKQRVTVFINYPFNRFYKEINKAAWKVVTDKVNIPATGLNKPNTIRQLKYKGVNAEVIEKFESVLNECEMALYTPVHDVSDMHQTLNKAEDVIETLKVSLP